MPIANVDLTNSLEYFRLITNQAIVAWNYITNNSLSSSVMTINPPSPVTGLVSLNVANGLIYGNGSGIYSYQNTGISGTFKNSQLQNSSVTLSQGQGINVVTSTASLNTGAIVITSNPVDSITNTSPFLPAAANAILRLLQSVTSVAKTTGRFGVNVGGTGVISYSNGQTFITNSTGSKVDVTTFSNGTGTVITSGAGVLSVGLNPTQGANITFSYTGNSGITISQNAYTNASVFTIGVTRVIDDPLALTSLGLSTSDAASANSLNAVSRIIALGGGSSGINAFGRLINVQTYETGTKTFGGRDYWSYSNVAQIAFLVVSVIGQGGGGGSANNGNTPGVWVSAMGGGAGASIKAIITQSQLASFIDDHGANTLTIYQVDSEAFGGNDINGNMFPGDRGMNGANIQIGESSTQGYILLVEGGQGGVGMRAVQNVGFCANTTTGMRVARAFANTNYCSVVQRSAGVPGWPGFITNRGSPGGGGPYHVTAISGRGARPQWERVGSWGSSSTEMFNTTSNNNYSKNQTGGDLGSQERTYGEGGVGGLSCNVAGGSPGPDKSGGNPGDAFVRIEVWTNA